MRKTAKEIRDAIRDQHQKQNGCDGKMRYLDEASANSRAKRDKEQFRGKKKKREGAHRAYRCKFCGYWHLGTIKNPTFRHDFVEIIKRGEEILKKIAPCDTRKTGPRTDLEERYAEGMMRPETLIHGEYYLGYSKHAVVARWHAQRKRFFYQKWSSREAQARVELSAPHPENDDGGFVFVPIDLTKPTFNQMVDTGFEEAAQRE